MTTQKDWQEEFEKRFFINSGSLSVEEVVELQSFILKIEADAERRGYNEGYSHALNACKILIANQIGYGALHEAIEVLEKSLNTPQS